MTEAPPIQTVSLDIFIRRAPLQVRRWWTEFPDDYRAPDPREQPYRVVVLKRRSDGAHLRTYWKRPDGTEIDWEERMTVDQDGGWAFDIHHPLGIDIRDEFHPREAEGGTRLEIRSVLRPKDATAAAQVVGLRERMTRGWKLCAELCEAATPPK